ncbi:hypothetical protein M9435_002372 [Picochlorum sp. BPE23]|nr:hypothetical protein M9435_002372 [Picochlorum sp. BPE23]
MLRRATRFPRLLHALPGSLCAVGEKTREIWCGMNLGEDVQRLGCLQGVTDFRLDSATRGFASLGSEQEVERNEDVAPRGVEGTFVAAGAANGNGEVVGRFHDKMDNLKKKRKKVPLMSGESFEEWLEKHDETLEPLRDFFRVHDMDGDWAIAELYKNGYWGKKLMRTVSDSGAEQEGSYPWEESLEVWTKAFEEENLPHSPLDIMRRWPSLLCKTPDCLPGTVAVLKAAIPDEEALHETIAMFPRVLVQSPVKLQHRVLALQMACGMDLSRILPRNPQMFYRNLDSIMANIRYLRDHSWSLEHFESLIDYRPTVLTMHPDVVKRNTESSLEAVQMILPEGCDPKLVIQAKPQLILIPPSHIAERWEVLTNLTNQVPEWKEEVQDAIADIAKAAKSSTTEPNAPSTDPVKDTFGAENAKEKEAPSKEEDIPVDEWEAGEWGSTTLGAAIWAHPKRHQRLEFLITVVGDGAGELSFVDALTVHYHRFNHRYDQFDEWVRENYN